jgi:molybdate transport system permease protein
LKSASKPIGLTLIVLGVAGIIVTAAFSYFQRLDVVSSVMASILCAALFAFVPGTLLMRWSDLREGEPFLPAEWVFYLSLWILGGSYLVLIVAMLIADVAFAAPDQLADALIKPVEPRKEDGIFSRGGRLVVHPEDREFAIREEIKYSIWLSLISCSVTAILSIWVGVPMGYLLARTQFWGKFLVDALLDIPIVLPPLVIGLSLLILFQTQAGKFLEDATEQVTSLIGRPTRITYAVPSVILAQFAVAAAFAVRTMRVTFEQISPRTEQVAMTLGCTRAQAFWRVVLPEAWRGILTAATLSWARSLGEFGPILIFSGATRLRTEVLPTTVFLELSVGKIEAAIAVSLLMIAAAVIVLMLTRTFGLRGTGAV